MRQVHTNFIAATGVGRVVGQDLDGSTGFVEAEVMGGGFMGETHGVVAARNDAGIGRGALLEGNGCQN